MTEQDLFALLRKRYDPREWVLLPQVRDATGWAGAGRTADAIAMNTWPSRGLEVHGIEIKTYRSDWQRELKKPQKAEAIFKFCDRWWIAVPDHEGVTVECGRRQHPMIAVATPDELPPTWGLLYVSDKRIRVGREAPKLEPVPLTRTFVASVLRGSMRETPEAQLEAAKLAGVKEGHDYGYKLGLREGADRASARMDWDWRANALKYIEESVKRTLNDVGRHRKELDEKLAALGEEPAAPLAAAVAENDE